MRVNLLSAALAVSLVNPSVAHDRKTRNFIYVVPDGFGPASQTLARDYLNIINGNGTAARPNSAAIGADSIVIGNVRTQASDNLITDSAASATAFSCGHKTYNGAIGVDDDVQPLGSILEAAHMSGFKTGLVVTSRITHATPGAYAAHVAFRDAENDIANHQIGFTHPLGSVVDLLMGGGRRHYLPKKEGGVRTDDVNLINWAKGKGFKYASDKSDFAEYTKRNGTVPLPFLGLFASSHMDYEIDRNPEKQPSLLEMTQVALKTLGKASLKSNKGYFIMIEASRIDHAAHANDIAGHVHDVLMYNEVMACLKKFVSENPDTQLLSAADHETGGITLRGEYNPAVVAKATQSTEYLEDKFSKYEGSDKAAFLKSTILPAYGLANASDADVDRFMGIFKKDGVAKMGTAILHDFAKSAGINWSTGDHSAVDVVLYGFAVGNALTQMKQQIGRHVNNIELPRYIEKVLGVSLDKTTEALRKNGTGWVGKNPKAAKRAAMEAAENHLHGHH